MDDLRTKSIMSRIFSKIMNASCHKRRTTSILTHYKFRTHSKGPGREGFHTVTQVSRRVNSSSHSCSIWNKWLSHHHGHGREKAMKAHLRLTVSVSLSYGQLGRTWHSCALLPSHGHSRPWPQHCLLCQLLLCQESRLLRAKLRRLLRDKLPAFLLLQQGNSKVPSALVSKVLQEHLAPVDHSERASSLPHSCLSVLPLISRYYWPLIFILVSASGGTDTTQWSNFKGDGKYREKHMRYRGSTVSATASLSHEVLLLQMLCARRDARPFAIYF